jgi:hypothetical protein
MPEPFDTPVSPFPGWKRRVYRLSRLVTTDDIQAFLGNEDGCTRETPGGTIHVIHKYGLFELGFIVGEAKVEVWSDPESGAHAREYLDALLATRFSLVAPDRWKE